MWGGALMLSAAILWEMHQPIPNSFTIFLDFNVDWGGQPTLAKYFEENPKGLPDPDAAIGCQVLLLKLFSVEIWKKLLTFLDADGDGEVSTEELKALDIDGKYLLSKYHLRFCLQVGHETPNAPSGKHKFFTISCHRQTYQFNSISGDGKLSKAELRAAISKVAGLSTIEGTVYISRGQ